LIGHASSTPTTGKREDDLTASGSDQAGTRDPHRDRNPVAERSNGKRSNIDRRCGGGVEDEDEAEEQIYRSRNEAFGERDLRGAVAIEAGGDGGVDSPAHTRRSDKDRTEHNPCVRGPSENHRRASMLC
jgi:hypothetical protein